MTSCQACGKPANAPEIPGLCSECAARIDRDTDELLEREKFVYGPGDLEVDR